MMRILYERGLYFAAEPDAVDVAALKARGWKWSVLTRAWSTSDISRVTAFKDNCVTEAEQRVAKFSAARHQQIAASIAIDSDMSFPCPEGLDYRGYQKAGIAFGLSHKRALNADVPRLGKTIQGIGVANCLPSLKNTLIVCEANTKTQWAMEWKKWSVHKKLSVDIVSGSVVPKADVTIMNFALVPRHANWIQAKAWDYIIVDEAHNLSGTSSQRKEALLGKGKIPDEPAVRSDRWHFLTGTPIYTRPIGIWPVVHCCDPESLGRSWWDFAKRYTGAEKANGWDTSGHQNEDELQYRLRKSFMIRREKSDVMEEIPAARHTIVFPKEGLEKLVSSEFNQFADKLAKFEADALAEAELLDLDPIEDGSPIVTRQDLALAKLPMCIEWINELLLTEKKVVVFAHHRAVVQGLVDGLGQHGVCRVWGGLSTAQRDYERDEFQRNPDKRVFIGNIRAAGSGITLSAADCVVFIELSWSPAEIDQAEERIWLPEKKNPMTIYRLVVEDSIDMMVAHILDRRQEAVQRTLSKRFLPA